MISTNVGLPVNLLSSASDQTICLTVSICKQTFVLQMAFSKIVMKAR